MSLPRAELDTVDTVILSLILGIGTSGGVMGQLVGQFFSMFPIKPKTLCGHTSQNAFSVIREI